MRGTLTKDMALRAVAMGADAVTAVMLAANGRIVQLQAGPAPASGANTPSGAIPLHTKGRTGKKRPGKPGARDGHEGHRRSPPTIDRREDVAPITVCPDCHGHVLPPRKHRTRTVEDIKPDAKSEAVEYTIGQHWCATCKKHVEPGLAAAMPGATIGNGVVALSAVMHYGLGLTLAQVQEIFSSHIRTELSAGGLVDMWRRAGEVFTTWYEQIGREARNSATLHADETSWRVNGDGYWLWCFCNHRNCYYLIDESRGGDVLRAFFTEAYAGVLLSDFWKPYQSVQLAAAMRAGEGTASTTETGTDNLAKSGGEPKSGGERQACLVHLLREISHLTEHALPGKSKRDAGQWTAFASMLKRLLKDGIRLRQREDFTPKLYGRRITLIDRRLMVLAEGKYDDPDANRLANRLLRYRDEIFTFLDRPESAWHNNFAERQIRPAVILRKNSQCNRSERGAATQAVMMTIYRTLKLRGFDARAEIEKALRAWSETGKLPELPAIVVGFG